MFCFPTYTFFFQGSCSILADFTDTTLSIPEALIAGDDANPGTPRAKEVACATKGMGKFMDDKWKADVSSWEFLGVKPSSFYYASESTGMFREFPARHWGECHQWEPRARPWYLSASTGPKKVIFVLDTSEGVADKLPILIKGAKDMIGGFTYLDQVAIVTTTNQDGVTAQERSKTPAMLETATTERIEGLQAFLDGLSPSGSASYASAFDQAYSLLESTEQCNNAVIFFTNQDVADTDARNTVVNGISERNGQAQTTLGMPILVFTYALGQASALVTELACAVEYGVSATIPDIDSASSTVKNFYKVFAAAIAKNPEFVSWTAPYLFSDNRSIGTSIAAPVYDRTGDQPIFLGVAGIDFSLEQLDEAHELFRDETPQESINRLVALTSQSQCPMINMPACLIDTFRGDSCPSSCDETVPIDEPFCDESIVFPTNYWKNVEFKGMSLKDRQCCTFDNSAPAGTCADTEEEASAGATDTSSVGTAFTLIGTLLSGLVVSVF